MGEALPTISSGSSVQNQGTGQTSQPYSEQGPSLPQGYGETRVVLLPRDPNWMFSYWEVTEQTFQEIKSKYGEDIFTQAHPTVRMVQIQSNNGTIKPIKHVDVTVVLEAGNWYLRSEEDGSSWFVELGLKRDNGEFILIARSNYITLPRGRVSNLSDEKWATIKEEMEKLMAASGGGKVGMGSLELARMLAQRWEVLSQVSSWKGSGGVSSFGRPTGQIAQARNFWLTADSELILFGATEPTATLTVGGKPVELFADGTFSLRFALPDGELELPVTAISGDRVEERRIHISVQRKTKKD